MNNKTFVWSIYTRAFHMLFALSCVVAVLTGDSEDELVYDLHVASGGMAFVLVAFRFLWGMVGVRYSSFWDFTLSPKALFAYFTSLFGQKKEHAGHNPASSYSAIAMMGLALLLGASGAALMGVKDGSGILSSLYAYDFLEEPLEGVHEMLSNLLLAVAGAHIAGVLLEQITTKSDVARSMLTGYKNVEGEQLKLQAAHHLFGLVWIVSTAAIFGYLML